MLRTTPLLAPLHLWYLDSTSPLLGWPDGLWHGAPAVIELPALVVGALCIARTVAAAAFTLGLFTRWAGVIAGLTGYLVLAQDPLGFLFTLHLLFQGVIVLALAGAGETFALRPERPSAGRDGLRLVWLFVASIYLWAGIGKLRGDWLDGRTLGVFVAEGAIGGWPADVLLSSAASRSAVACAVAATELLLPLALLWRRARLLGLALALALHGGIEAACHPDFLGWEMVALLVTFLPPRAARAPLFAASGGASEK
jgi:hypothetical protein